MTSLSSMRGFSLNVDFTGRLLAEGRLAPVLTAGLSIAPPGTEQLRLDHLLVELHCNAEIVGEGHIVGAEVNPLPSSKPETDVRIGTTPRLIDFMTDQLGSAGRLRLEFRVAGAFRHRDQGAPDWSEDSIPGYQSPIVGDVKRSDWIERVLTPVRNADFVFLEVAVPRGSTGNAWRSATAMLRKAEDAYAAGDDDAVFGRLRGALDSFPGAKQNIFEGVLDTDKRRHLDRLYKAYGDYLHLGRHVGDERSDSPGVFPVNHMDARAAIGMMKVMLSYASHAL